MWMMEASLRRNNNNNKMTAPMSVVPLILMLLPTAALGFALSSTSLHQKQHSTTATTTTALPSVFATTSRPALTNLHSPYNLHSPPYSYSFDGNTVSSSNTLFRPSPAPRIIPASQIIVSTASMKQHQQQQQHKKKKSSSNSSQQKRPSAHSSSASTAATASSLLNNRHSASDWWYNVRSLPQSKVLREVRSPVLAVAGWSFAVSLIHRVLSSSTTGWMSSLAQAMCIPATAHGFLVSALGLLLVFRTNSAYQRFYEGRKIWQDILSISRNLSRTLHLYTRDVGVERKQYLLNLVAAYPYLLRHHIRPGCLCENKASSSSSSSQLLDEKHRLLLREPAFVTVETRYEGDSASGGQTRCPNNNDDETAPAECWVDRRKLPWCLFSDSSTPKASSTSTKKQGRRRGSTVVSSDLDQIARARNRPLWICDKIAHQIVSIPYSDNFTSRERLALLSQVDKLTNAIGQCERIQQTAVPLNYARHSLRSLTLWLFTLPFGLMQDLGVFLTAPAMAGIAWLLLGVYQIGYSIEDPFAGSLRLSILCDAIRRDVLDNNSSGNMMMMDNDDEHADDEEADAHLTATPPRTTVYEDSDDDSNFLPAAPTTMKQVNGQWAVVSAGQ